MIAAELRFEARLEELYGARDSEPLVRSFLGAVAGSKSDELAEAIEADAAVRLKRGLPVELGRYLVAAPGLADNFEALDAAIDVTVRASAEDPEEVGLVVDRLASRHPDIADAIRRSGALTDLFFRSAGWEEQAPPIELPALFGPALGERGERYRLTAWLGEGVGGAVYEAEDRWLSEPDRPARVAVKILKGRRSETDRAVIDAEARKSRRVEDRRVVRLLDSGTTDDGVAYLVMELAEGGSLDALVAGGGLDEWSARDAARFVEETARALHAVHQAGLIHCDLKPANVLLARDGEGVSPRLADFSAAFRRTSEVSGGRVVGTAPAGARGNLAFQAPETRGSEGAPTIASDVYALGSLLLYLLLVIEGRSGDEAAERVRAVEGDDPGVLAIDRRLSGVIARARSTDPSLRHDSAAALANDLADWLAHRPIAWQRPSAAERLRLLSRRAPWAVAAVSAAVVAATLAAAAGHLRLEQVAYERGEAEAKAALGDIMRTNGGLRTDAGFRDWLVVTAMLDAVSVFSYYDNLIGENASVPNQIGLLEDYLASLESSGAGDGLEANLWRLQLSLLRLSNKELRPETAGALERARSYFHARLDPSDPWFEVIGVLENAWVVKQRYLERDHHLLPRVPSDAEYESAYRELCAYLRSSGLGPEHTGFDESTWNDPLLLLALRATWHASGEQHLDDRPWRAWATAQKRVIDREPD